LREEETRASNVIKGRRLARIRTKGESREEVENTDGNKDILLLKDTSKLLKDVASEREEVKNEAGG